MGDRIKITIILERDSYNNALALALVNHQSIGQVITAALSRAIREIASEQCVALKKVKRNKYPGKHKNG